MNAKKQDFPPLIFAPLRCSVDFKIVVLH
ncbi:unnamed protein product, partial [Allacma fusca]